jgi:hypothetical protein
VADGGHASEPAQDIGQRVLMVQYHRLQFSTVKITFFELGLIIKKGEG